MANRSLFTSRTDTLNEKGEEIFQFFIKQEKKARDEKDLSQRDMSFLVNRSQGFISKMEKGEVLPSLTDLLAMTLILEKPFKYFIPSFAYYKSKEGETDGEEWELLQAFRKIKSEDAKRIAINTIEQLAEMK